MEYKGDVLATATVTTRFNTADLTNAAITLAGSAVARVRKGSGSGTTVTAGVTLTVDVVTGQHCVDVDLTASASYTVGSDYYVELSAGTVSGVSQVGKLLASFSIVNRAVAVATLATGVRSELATELGRLDASMSSRASQVSVDDLPTNAELATALSAADDAVLLAIVALSIPTANANADALLDRLNAIETGLSFRGAMRLVTAACAGKASGLAGTTATYRNAVADSKDRIVATVDSNGNRTAITTDVT